MLASTLLDILPAITREWRHELAEGLPEGVTVEQYRTLYMIHTGLNQCGTLSRGMGVSPAATSKMLDGLVRGGLVEKTPSDQDRRQVTITVTRVGESLIRQFHRQMERRLEPYFQFLSREEESRIEDALKLLQKALAQKGETP